MTPIGHTAAPYVHIVMDDGLAHEIGAPVLAMPAARAVAAAPSNQQAVSPLRASIAIAEGNAQ